jgi:hypothetical protein
MEIVSYNQLACENEVAETRPDMGITKLSFGPEHPPSTPACTFIVQEDDLLILT